MRSLEDARECWRVLQQYSSLREWKNAVRVESSNVNATVAATAGLRSVAWKAFLLFDDMNVEDWQRTLSASRSAYNSLRTHFFRRLDNSDELADLDPLGQDAESSPWHQMQKDEELRAEILQDVERIGMPDAEYFREPQRRRMLLDILFVFCKLNPDVGYRQGMHEIAAPIFFVVESDAVDITGISKTLGEDGTIKTVFDADHVEHDAFALFGQVMQNAKSFYLSDGPVSIASRSQHIFNDLLPQVDPDLVKHLKGMDVVPQVFLIRWVRLLFGREFDFDAVLALWDLIFAEDTSLELVDHICLAMLLRIRWHLLDADYNNALSLLLHYPELDKDFPAQIFGVDALYLKTHMSFEGGSFLVLKYTGRPLSASGGRPTTPPALQRNITTFAVRHAAHTDRKSRISPSRAPRPTNNIEAILQNTAKNLYARGEKLGIGKAVRTAVDEVHKKAQEIRDSQSSTPSSRRRSGNTRLLDHVRNLEARNKRLAGLLAGAVNELWEYQRLVAEQTDVEEQSPELKTIEKLSAAIAKVQFVQVYLDEPTLSLDDTSTNAQQSIDYNVAPDGRTTASAPGAESQNDSASQQILQNSSSPADQLADPSTFEDFDDPPDVPKGAVKGSPKDSTDVPQHAATGEQQPIMPEKQSRPMLAESAYSFMLDSTSPDGSNTAPSTSSRPRTDDRIFRGHRRAVSSQGKSTFSSTSGPLAGDQAEDEFDISSLRRAKGTRN